MYIAVYELSSQFLERGLVLELKPRKNSVPLYFHVRTTFKTKMLRVFLLLSLKLKLCLHCRTCPASHRIGPEDPTIQPFLGQELALTELGDLHE